MAVEYYYGSKIDSNKNTKTYAKKMVSEGKNHIVIDFVTKDHYYGREFFTDGSVIQWMRPLENDITDGQDEWDAATLTWRVS